MPDTKAKSSSTGLDPKIAGILAWIFAPISSIILVLVEKEDAMVKYHAWQSLVWGVVSFVLNMVLSTVLGFTIIFACLVPLVWIGLYIVNIYGAIKAYNGEKWKLPVVGDWGEQQAAK